VLYLEELKKLNFPPGQYAIYGSGPLAVRGLRKNGDIDRAIDEAEIIGGFPFVSLKCVLEYKGKMGRDKDREDVILLKII